MQNLYIIAGCNGAGKTTASFTILPEILECKEFINDVEIAPGLSPFQPERAAIRVEEGGHFIDENTITRQYYSGMKNLLEIYIPIVNYWIVLDNSDNPSELIAEGSGKNDLKIISESCWKQINSTPYGKR